MSFSLSDILFLVVIFQLLFTSMFLFTYRGGKGSGNRRGGRRSSNGLLGAFFLVIGLNLMDNLLLIRGAYTGNPGFGLWSVWLLLLFGPLLYLYTQSILYRDFRLSLSKGWHFLPFVLLFIITEIYWQTRGPAERRLLLEQVVARKVPGYQYWDSALIFVQFFLYMFASFRLIGRFKRAAGNAFSDYRRIDIRWLSNSLLFFTAAMALAAVNSFIGLTSLAAYWLPVFLVVVGFVWVYINVLLLKALRDSGMFALLGKEPLVVEKEEKGADWRGELEQLRIYMETRRPWLDPDLTLEQLALQLKLRPKLLSQAINEGLSQNFFEFINRYRIGEAKRLLTNPADKKITVLEVLYQVGFNSKSSFNTLFKKQTGLTPSEFKRKMAG